MKPGDGMQVRCGRGQYGANYRDTPSKEKWLMIAACVMRWSTLHVSLSSSGLETQNAGNWICAIRTRRSSVWSVSSRTTDWPYVLYQMEAVSCNVHTCVMIPKPLSQSWLGREARKAWCLEKAMKEDEKLIPRRVNHSPRSLHGTRSQLPRSLP